MYYIAFHDAFYLKSRLQGERITSLFPTLVSCLTLHWITKSFSVLSADSGLQVLFSLLLSVYSESEKLSLHTLFRYKIVYVLLN